MKKIILILIAGIFVTCLISPPLLAIDKQLTLTATASSAYYNYPQYGADKTIDNNMYTYWIGGRDAAPWWIMFDAGDVVDVDSINMEWYPYNYYIPTNYDMQISNDGTNWENIYSGIQGVATETKDIKRQARYIRLYIRSVGSYYPVLKEFKAYKGSNIPKTIRFQGTLTDSNGIPLDDTVSATFRLYEDAAGGVPVWEETQSGVSVTNGAFDVELGSVTPFEIVFDKQYWLGVQVSPDAEMTPLFKLTSVPYAFVSEE